MVGRATWGTTGAGPSGRASQLGGIRSFRPKGLDVPACRAQHPDDEQRHCIKDPDGRHEFHGDRTGTWQNGDYGDQVRAHFARPKKKPSTRDTKRAMGDFLAQQEKTPEQLTRRTDPDTSLAAAASLGDLRDAQVEVYRLFEKAGPMSDEMLLSVASAENVGQTPSGLRTRRSELVEAGLVVDTGRKGKTSTGHSTIIWDLAP